MSSDRAGKDRSFFEELKRRHVVRVAIVYGAVAFAIMEAADLMFSAMGLPEWTYKLLVALAVLGFPIALVLAWAFEITPDGVRVTRPAAEVTDRVGRATWLSPRTLLVAATLVAVGAAMGWVLKPGAAESRASSEDSLNSIAVLPFVNMSGNPENEYFADGLAEELLNALAGVQGLKVAARTSAFAFKGRDADVREIGHALDVETVLEGSVRRAGDRVRISAQLIGVDDGFHIWSKTYDRRLTDVFAVQDEISRAIVEALAVSLGARAEERGLFLGGTEDVEAYELYMRGRQRWATRYIDQLHLAIGEFEAALARDSTFALAWSGLADAIDALAWREPEARSLVPRGLAAARRAISLEPDLAEGHASLGVLLYEFERDYPSAEAALRRAVELKPGYSPARHWYGDLLRNTGRLPRALEQHAEAARLDPLSGVIQDTYAATLVAARRWEDAFRQYGRAIQVPRPVPSSALNLVTYGRELGLSAERLADIAESYGGSTNIPQAARLRVVGAAVVDSSSRSAALEVLTTLATELDREEAWYRERELAELWMVHRQAEPALYHLERAFAAQDPTLLNIGVDPVWDPLREAPRYVRLIEALGLPNGYFPDR